MSSPRRLVLDTNVILDWLVFADPYMDPLRHAARDGTVHILTHPPADAELLRVLGYPVLKLDASRQVQILSLYRSQTQNVAMPEAFAPERLLLPEKFPRCRDRDDQPFFALAYHGKADALVSRDKAVLKLANRAAKFGVRVLNVQEMIGELGSG